jgi:hypothetical protein
MVDFFVSGKQVGGWNLSQGHGFGIEPSRLVIVMMTHLSQPRALAHCLRQLQLLTTLMRKRAEGRRRAAAEILRQQRKWVEMLEGETAMNRLAQ